MNTNELLFQWSNLSLAEIEARLQAPRPRGGPVASEDAGDAVDHLFGPEEAEELRSLASAPRPRGIRPAAVFLPGIMGSQLASVRGVTRLLWINPLLFLHGECSYLELSDDGSRDRQPQIEAVATGLEKMTYVKTGLALRREVDLYEFPFDWRRPIESSADLLHRTLERWAGGDPAKQFTLIGHSLGGLVSRAYLALHPRAAEQRVARLIMYGSPQFGATQTIQNLYEGNRMMDIAGLLNGDNDTRHLLLNLPSVYQILPAPPDLFPSHRPYPADWDLYDAAAWRLEGIRQDYLDLARRFHELLSRRQEAAQVEIVQFAGCHVQTLVEVQHRFTHGERLELAPIWIDEGADSGDGTVPLWSSILPGATIYYVQDQHRALAKNRDVLRGTLDVIHDGHARLPTELPEPERGWLRRDAPVPADVEAAHLRLRLELGSADEEDLSKLFFAL
ncbi:MAG TPA: alpha/beta fold hydrolase [Anaerolineae bacterium]|nr:alpha/beta fold hydrolase [Anaerolineae bacterium]